MTGICGWFNINNDTNSAKTTIKAMASVVSSNAAENVQVLASPSHAMACSSASKQQCLYDTHDVLLACSGHIHWINPALKKFAGEQGDAAAIAKIYHEKGESLFEEVHGDFSLALIDKTKELVILAVDRLGIQPLCFYLKNQSLIFSSDAQGLFKQPVAEKDLSSQGIYNYFYFHMVPSPGSIFKNVEKLLPGQRVFFSRGHIEKKFYWNIPYQDANPQTFEQLNDNFHGLLKSSVQSRIDSTSIGAFLSGGLDSSTVSGILSQLTDSPAKTYSIGFDAKGYDETPFARIVAKHFNTEHHEYYVTPEDVVNTIPLIAEFYDEPFGNASALPAYFCARLAKADGIHRMLAGDGGDEIFAGNERYTKQQIFEHYLSIPEILRSRMIEPLFSFLPRNPPLPVISKIHSYIQQAKIPLPARLERYNFLNRTPLEDIFNREFLTEVNTDWPIDMLNEVYNRTQSEDTLHKMLHLDMKVTIADNDIRKVNKMCALAGIDVVYPFLDEEMVNFAAAIPPGLKIKQGKLRYFFKRATTGFLPDATINKEKHGFGLPFGVWMKEHKALHDLARDNLHSLAQRDYFNKTYIEDLWQRHEKEHSSYYGVMIWVMMMFELWLTTAMK